MYSGRMLSVRKLHNTLLCFFLIFLLLGSRPVNANMLDVAIRQVNPDGDLHTAMCSNDYNKCYMTMDFVPEGVADNSPKSYLDIVISFDGDGAYFHFMLDREYLFAADFEQYYYKLGAYDFMEGTQSVKLYRPHPLYKRDRHGSLVWRPSNFIAELEISARPGPP